MERGQLNRLAAHVAHFMGAVSLSMLLAVGLMRTSGRFASERVVHSVRTPWSMQAEDSELRLLLTAGNLFNVLCLVVGGSFGLFLLYKHRFYNVSSLRLNWMDGCDLTVDLLTFCFLLWNVGVLGVLCINWEGPHRLQKFSSIVTAALIAVWWVELLPDWTLWGFVVLLAVWDLLSVLHSNGPLRMLEELMLTPCSQSPSSTVEEETEDGMQVGLADFIFYSLLVGKANTLGDWKTTAACCMVVLIGLIITLLLLECRKSLPALPIPVFISVFFCFAARAVAPFMADVSTKQCSI
ncbi:Presenilin [Aphelenchoides fujianensis]|nr:Presenilin [Aphelenchoides fujianensis]